MLVSIGAIDYQKSKATQTTRDTTIWILNYAASHPNAIIRYSASDMVLHLHSDTYYLSEPGACSHVGGHYFLGTNFGFSGGRHQVVEDLGDGMDRAIKRGFRERWIGRVSGFFANEIVSTDAAASPGFGKVGGVTMEVQDHVTGAISDDGVWVGCHII